MSVYKHSVHPHHNCKLKGQAEAVVVVPVVGIVVVTIRNTTVVRIVVPVTTAKHTIRALTTLPNFAFCVFIEKRKRAWDNIAYCIIPTLLFVDREWACNAPHCAYSLTQTRAVSLQL